ncbi:hypothetical protein Tco_1568863 [Tanacetum coccineum]
MVIVNWKLRPKENDPNLFSLKVNHRGGFSYVYGPKRTRAPWRVYKGGNADRFDDVDAYGFSVIEVSDKGIEPLSKDIDVLDLLSYVHKFKLIELFIEHHVDTCVLDTFVIGFRGGNAGFGTHESEGIENDNAGLGIQESEGIENDNVKELDPLFSYPNTNHQIGQSSERITSPHRNVQGNDDNEESDDTKESEDNDLNVGSTKPQSQVENNDQFMHEECDLEDFDSDIDPDDDEAERKKALRKINMVSRISVEKMRELYLTKNDKERVRAECRGLVHVFSNTGPSGDSGSNVEGPNDGPIGS